MSLKYKGDAEHKMLCGGCVTISLRVLILAFFVMQLLAVANFDDPQISSYEVFEDRNSMDKPLNLADLKAGFYFGFFSLLANKNVRVEPRIGQFELNLLKYHFKNAKLY